MTTVEKLLTAEEFACLPEPIEGGKMELIYGRVVTMPPATGEHGERAFDIGSVLRAFARLHGLGKVGGETGFTLAHDPDVVLAPDAYFIEQAHVERVNWQRGYVEGAPTLAVEIVSPNDRDTDVATKVQTYLDFGSPRVWVVRPKTKTVTVHRPGGDSHTFGLGDTLTSADAGFSVEGFALKLDELFA